MSISTSRPRGLRIIEEADGSPSVRADTLIVSNGSLTDNGDGSVTLVTGGAGASAPVGAQYVTLATDATLTDERVLTPGDGLDLTDGGAGSTVTLDVDLKANGGLVIESTEIAVDLGASSITGTLVVGDGGTGAVTFTDGGVLIGNVAGAIQVTTAGTAGQILTSNGAGVDPTFQVSGAGEINNLEVITTGIATTEIPIGTAANTVVYAPLSGGVSMINDGTVTVLINANLTGDVTSVGNATTTVTNANLTGIVTSVGNATAIADGAVAFAKLADGTDGELITWDAAGVIDTVAVGTATEVLTSNGVGTAPTFQAIPAQAEVNNLETITTGIATTEIPIGTAANTVVYAALSGDISMTNAGVVTVTHSLDEAYNDGNTIDVDGSPVTLTVSNTDNNEVLNIIQNDTTNNPDALTIANTGTGDGLFINQDGNGIALSLDSQATTASIIDMRMDTLTTGFGLVSNVSGQLTSGGFIFFKDNSSTTDVRSLVTFSNENVLATGVTVFRIGQSSTGPAVVLGKAATDGGMINFEASVDADTTSAISSLTTSGSIIGHVQIEINGTKRWLAFLADPS